MLRWWLLYSSRSARVLSLVLWLVSLVLVLVQTSAASVLLFELASGITVILWVVPVLRVAYRLHTRVRHQIPAGWHRADVELSKELRSDWMEQVHDIGFNLAGYLTKDRDSDPCLALFINSENRDSAHVSRVAGKDLLVFKTRFADGFAFETGNTASVPLLPGIPNNPVFRFSQIASPLDLYRVHRLIRGRLGSAREPVISDGEDEIAEFISRAEVVRSHMMSRDYRRQTLDNVYVFTLFGAVRHATLLTWTVKPIRELIFRRKAQKELARLGFRLDKKTSRMTG